MLGLRRKAGREGGAMLLLKDKKERSFRLPVMSSCKHAVVWITFSHEWIERASMEMRFRVPLWLALLL